MHTLHITHSKKAPQLAICPKVKCKRNTLSVMKKLIDVLLPGFFCAS